jgi:MarR family transcriptional regulator for hemolysin
MERAINEELAAHGITYPQWQVLAWLSLAGGALSQVQLAERLQVEPPTLAGILDRMERNGWIVRESDPTDRRRKLVRPAEDRVAPVWRKMVACAHRVRARATAGIDPHALDCTMRTLATVLANLDSAAPLPTPEEVSS